MTKNRLIMTFIKLNELNFYETTEYPFDICRKSEMAILWRYFR